MNCINTVIAGTELCYTLPDDEQPPCLCAAFQAQADCWAAGLYWCVRVRIPCVTPLTRPRSTEWIPLQRSADKMCALAKGLDALPVSSSSAYESAVTSVAVEQAAASNSIWNNDSGTDLPVVSDFLNPAPRTETNTHLTTRVPLAYTAGAAPITTPDFAAMAATSGVSGASSSNGSSTSSASATPTSMASASASRSTITSAPSASLIVNAVQPSADARSILGLSAASSLTAVVLWSGPVAMLVAALCL
jgi:hypothetical protein